MRDVTEDKPLQIAFARGWITPVQVAECLKRAQALPGSEQSQEGSSASWRTRSVLTLLREGGYLGPDQCLELRVAAGERVRDAIPGYEIETWIAETPFGVLYRATQLSMQRPVTVKVLSSERMQQGGYRERLFREAKAAARIHHPNVLVPIEAGEAGGLCYLVREYVQGETLRKLLAEKGPFAERQALEIACSIARALQQAEELGLVHRDICPENILIARDGTPKLADMGLLKWHPPGDSDQTDPDLVLGSLDYMSPEQAAAEPSLDVRSDLYSLGLTLYEMLTGLVPFQANSLAQAVFQRQKQPLSPVRSRNPNVSEATAVLLEMLLEPDRERRVPSAGLLVEDLERILRGEPPRSAPETARSASWMAPRSFAKAAISWQSQLAGVRQERSARLVVIGGCIFLGAAAVWVAGELLRNKEASSGRTAVPAPSSPQRTPQDLPEPLSRALQWEKEHPDDVVKLLELYRHAEELSGHAGESLAAAKLATLEIRFEREILPDKLRGLVEDVEASLKTEEDYGKILARIERERGSIPSENWREALENLSSLYEAEASGKFLDFLEAAREALEGGRPQEARVALDRARSLGFLPPDEAEELQSLEEEARER